MCKKNVNSYLKKRRATEVRKQIQQRDDMILQNHPHRFRSTHQSKKVCSKLLDSDGTVITDTKDLLECWADHFDLLGQSHSPSNESLQESERKVKDYLLASYDECDKVLDTEFNVEEILHAIQCLKQRRAGGPDGISPEHLKFSGPIFQTWLCQIYNHICQLEQIPECFKRGIIIPAFKGKGRDPLLKKNYRGVTLTSVLAKVLEIAIMQRLEPILDDAGIPQTTQTAYRKGVSCQDSIFAGMETNTRFLLQKEKFTQVSTISPVLLTLSNSMFC